jgi:hypothetical protein
VLTTETDQFITKNKQAFDLQEEKKKKPEILGRNNGLLSFDMTWTA